MCVRACCEHPPGSLVFTVIGFHGFVSTHTYARRITECDVN